jgi:hypothetical protein
VKSLFLKERGISYALEMQADLAWVVMSWDWSVRRENG